MVCVFLAIGGLVIARLAQMQLVRRGGLEEYYQTGVLPGHVIETTRGTIYTGDGEVLAHDVPVFELCVKYDRLEEQDWRPWVSEVCGVTTKDLDTTCQDIRRRVERIAERVRTASGGRYERVQEQDWYHPVVKDIPRDVAALVYTQPDSVPDGLKVIVGGKRIYPNGNLAPHIVGVFSQLWPEDWDREKDAGRAWWDLMAVSEIGKRYRMDDFIGHGGLERSYESLLRGRRGYVEKRLVFRTLRLERASTTSAPEPGLDVHLTLRADFQRAVNETLQWAADQPHPGFERGAIVVLDVRDGAVLAAGTYPSYSPEAFGDKKEYKALLDDPRIPMLFRPTQAALPTGSVFKLITAIAALEEDKIDASDTFHCSGYKMFGRRRFNCTWGHGSMTLLPAIEQSCNVFFWEAGLRVRGGPLARWAGLFGFGHVTGVDLPENKGQVPEPSSRFGTMNLAIGQGALLCTPMQVARMCAAIANGGRLVQPHLFERATTADGKVVRIFEPNVRAIEVRAETLRLVREGMRRVVQVQSGTAWEAGLGPFNAAGKTGTAELQGTPLNHAWFAGFAPFENPKIAFAVVSELTEGGGGSHAAPIIAELLDKIWPEVEGMR